MCFWVLQCKFGVRKGINELQSRIFANERTRFCKCSSSNSISAVLDCYIVIRILDLYTRFHMITNQYSPFLPTFKSDLQAGLLVLVLVSHLATWQLKFATICSSFISALRTFSLSCFTRNLKLQYCMFNLLIKQNGLAFVSSLTYFFSHLCECPTCFK